MYLAVLIHYFVTQARIIMALLDGMECWQANRVFW